LHLNAFRVATLVVCLALVALSGELTRLHVAVHTDDTHESYCAVGEGLSCDAVSLSPWSVAMGLPLSVWGLLFYAAMTVFAAWGIARDDRAAATPFGVLFVLSVVASAAGLLLLFISHFVIESVCLLCAAAAVLAFVLLGLCLIALRRAEVAPLVALRDDLGRLPPRPSLVSTAVFVLVASLTWAFYPSYWETPTGQAQPIASEPGVGSGRNEEGHPWIGAAEPRLTIVEYSDYQCPFCRRSYEQMRSLVTRHPDVVRIVHRHFPLDSACNDALDRPVHPQACRYAKMGICAARQGRFWAATHYLFTHAKGSPIDLPSLAEGAGLDAAKMERCLDDPATTRALQQDIEAGQAAGVRGTPSFVIDGQLYEGRVPPDVLDRAIGS
jgi:protein-disulfide isomerase/uncharacterized membrane protein